MKKYIIKKDWDYSFHKYKNMYILSVVCGSVALFEIKIELNKEELKRYKEEGHNYIERLVRDIQFSPSAFSERNID